MTWCPYYLWICCILSLVLSPSSGFQGFSRQVSKLKKVWVHIHIPKCFHNPPLISTDSLQCSLNFKDCVIESIMEYFLAT